MKINKPVPYCQQLTSKYFYLMTCFYSELQNILFQLALMHRVPFANFPNEKETFNK